MDVNKYAAERLKELRCRKHLTQQELADELNINQKQISRFENNQRQFKQDFLFKLADYFGVSINCFFPIVDDDEFDKVLMDKFKPLTSEQKQKVIDMIDIIR